MKLRYHKDIRGNFGDDLNVPFFETLCPGFESVSEYRDLLGIGTLLNESLDPLQNAIVMGSGYGQGRPPKLDLRSTKIFGVRGPRTAKALDLDAQRYVIGDPALYLPYVDQLNHGKAKASDCIVFALHHRTAELWEFPKEPFEGIYFLDPGAVSVSDYIATIKSAKYVVAEAMHGAIVAVAYDVPFARFNILGKTDPTKWLDFFESVNISNNFIFNSEVPARPILRRAILKCATVVKSPSLLDIFEAPSLRKQLLIEVAKKAQSSEIDRVLLRADPKAVSTLTQKFQAAIYEFNDLISKSSTQ